MRDIKAVPFRWMKFGLTIFVALVCLTALSSPSRAIHRSRSAPSTDVSSTSSTHKSANRSANSDVRVSGTNGQFFGQVVVSGTPSTAWEVLTDFNNFARIFPNVERSRLLRQEGNQVVFEQVNVVRVAVVTRRNRVVMSALQQYPREIRFRAIEGDVRSLQGVWQILPRSGNQVMITHQVTVEPGDGSPRGLFFTIYRSELRSTLAALKQEIERRGR